MSALSLSLQGMNLRLVNALLNENNLDLFGHYKGSCFCIVFLSNPRAISVICLAAIQLVNAPLNGALHNRPFLTSETVTFQNCRKCITS